MSYQSNYEKWLKSDIVDAETKSELMRISGDDGEIKSRFSSMLEFGTAGLRGILGAGLNRMNIYTVRYATQGLANLIKTFGKEAMDRGVAIAYDSRIMSKEFSKEAALCLAANGIKSFLFDDIRPTPELSFTVRHLGCIAGINITASHNPKEYNGYKVYWEDGAQLSPEHAQTVFAEILKADIFGDVKTTENGDGYITVIGNEVDEAYLERVMEKAVGSDSLARLADNFRIIYTPFHGAGYKLVPEVLRRLGAKDIVAVPEQMIPDGNFPTVKSPNPEDKEGFNLAIKLAQEKGADIILGTDPDSDRVGVIVKDEKGEYIALSGNQIGVILLDYIITALKEKNALPENACCVKTIVTSEMAAEICKRNGVAIKNVFTGFKFIGEKIKEWEKTGEHTFIFGYEESYGYLGGTYCRDKDAVYASMMLCCAAAYYKEKGKNLYEVLCDLYEKYGYYCENTVSITMTGADGIEKTKALMGSLRNDIQGFLGGIETANFRDYLAQKILLKDGTEKDTGMIKSNVVYYELADGCRLIVRPSGTEPKVKLYIMTNGSSKKDAADKAEKLLGDFKNKFNI